MASEAELRARISNLERVIRKNEQKRLEFQRRIQRKTTVILRQLEEDYQDTLQRKIEETEAAYAERLRIFQERILAESHAEISRLEGEMAQLAEEQQQRIRELEDLNRQIKQQFDTIRTNLEEEQNRFRNAALTARSQAATALQEADRLPHEFFAPGQFTILEEQWKKISGQLDQGMYQAAAAEADGIALEAELLRVSVNEEFAAWQQLWQEYQYRIEKLAMQMELYEKTEITTAFGKSHMSQVQRNFWSIGEYGKLAQKIRAADALISNIESAGLLPWLKQANAETVQMHFFHKNEIERMLVEARKMQDDFTAIANCINSERLMSDERYVLGRQIADSFEAVGYSITSACYHAPSNTTYSKDWYLHNPAFAQENMLDTYQLTMALDGTDPVHIRIVPVRQHGLTVRNECLVWVEREKIPDEILIGQIEQTVRQRIRETAIGDHVNIVILGQKERQNLESQENNRKKNPSPEEQQKHLEQKYR